MTEIDHSSAHWTFVAEFDDGIVTRMTTSGTAGKLDFSRGIALSRAAYESRTKQKPSRIVAAKFIDPGNGSVIKTYSNQELDPVNRMLATAQLNR